MDGYRASTEEKKRKATKKIHGCTKGGHAEGAMNGEKESHDPLLRPPKEKKKRPADAIPGLSCRWRMTSLVPAVGCYWSVHRQKIPERCHASAGVPHAAAQLHGTRRTRVYHRPLTESFCSHRCHFEHRTVFLFLLVTPHYQVN